MKGLNYSNFLCCMLGENILLVHCTDTIARSSFLLYRSSSQETNMRYKETCIIHFLEWIAQWNYR